MTVMKEFLGRTFTEVDWFQPIYRETATWSSNNLWLTTVERGLERDTDSEEFIKTIIKIVRWHAINDKDNDNKKIWVYSSSYNIRSNNEWESTSIIVNRLMEGDIRPSNLVSMSDKEFNRIYRMKAHQNELESILHKYKELISDNYTNETQVKDFIEEHQAFWMFGLEYIGMKREVGFPPGRGKKYLWADFMLRRYDGFLDLVECKGPNENLFDKRTLNTNKPNKSLSEALGQVFQYLYAVDKTGDEDIIKPKAFIVIGKHETDRPSERRLFSSYLSNIELITYFELDKRGQRLLKYIKTASF